jgi:hypothetical protein
MNEARVSLQIHRVNERMSRMKLGIWLQTLRRPLHGEIWNRVAVVVPARIRFQVSDLAPKVLVVANQARDQAWEAYDE